MKTYSIKRRMTILLAGFILSVLITSSMHLLAQTKGYFQLNRIYSLFKAYNSYEKSADILKESVIQCVAVPSEDNIECMLMQADELDSIGQQLFTLGGKHYRQFEDASQLTAAYHDRIQSFAENSRTSAELLQADAQELAHFHELIVLQYETLEAYISSIVDNIIGSNAFLWRTLLVVTLCMSIVMLIYTIIGSMSLTRTIVTPITQLTQSLMAFKEKQQPLPASAQPASCCEEFIVLYDTYQDMAQTITMQIDALHDKIELSEELRKKQAALSAAEMGLMQSLIKPHFLYNCMSTLSSLAMIENAPHTRQSALLIASFLRMSLDRVGKIISIREELICTQKYLDIQKLRFSDMIVYSVSCEPACMNALIPAMLIQPLVENAIQHGLASRTTGGRIDIQIERHAGFIHLNVVDNGKGIGSEKLEELQALVRDDFDPEQSGVGLRSVVYRLRSIFGNEMRFEIRSKVGKTRICIVFPFRQSSE